MAFPLNVVEAVFKWTLPNGAQAINVLHFKRQGGADFTSLLLEDLGALLDDWYRNNDFQGETNTRMVALIDTAVVLNEIQLSDVGPGPTITYTQPIALAGASGGTPLAIESAWVSTWRTAHAGRSGRGRTFWPGLNDNWVNDAGALSGASVTLFQDTCAALADGLVTEGSFLLTVFSPTNSEAYQVTSVTVSPVIHHQSRRNG